ncbi:MAG: response regulator [Zetaproteobacteria bacterium]|nr:MAG: response regulator [Zetaproteobacteria bacterium]
MARILIAEDSAYMRRLIRSILERGGHSVEEAVNGDDCLRRLDGVQPDLLLLDLVMPERDGISVLGRLKKQGSRLPVIVLTADIQESVRRGCLDLGAVDFLNKPPKEGPLLAAVDRALESGEGDGS